MSNLTETTSWVTASADTFELLAVLMVPWGLLFNFLAYTVFKSFEPRSTGTTLLQFLALWDSLGMVTGNWQPILSTMGFPSPEASSRWICKIQTFLAYGSGQIAAWHVLAASCDRVVGIVWPIYYKEKNALEAVTTGTKIRYEILKR